MILFEKTYQMEPSAPPPMARSDYRAFVEREWRALLERNPLEKDMQTFLEEHPAMVPGAFGIGSPSGHAPFPGALISQPELYGYRARKPDFLWLSKNSLHLNPILIEIESPRKKMFTAKGVPTAEFTHARNQLLDWKAWLSTPGNQEAFLRAYDVNFPTLKCEPHFLLIYGRRDEFENNERLTRLRAEQMSGDTHLMSFDRIWFEPKADAFPSVRHTPNGYEVLHLPASYELGPCMFDYDQPLIGRLAAAQRNPLMSDKRKDFMRRRIPYWEQWSKGPNSIYSTGDRE